MARIALVPGEGPVVEQRLARGAGMIAAFRRVRQEQEGGRVHRLFGGGVLQHLLGKLVVGGLEQRPSEEGERLAAVVRPDGPLERLEGFAQRGAVVVGLRRVEPHPAEGDADVRVVRVPVEGLPQGRHRAVDQAGTRVRQAQGDAPRRRGIERRQGLELCESFLGMAHSSVEIGKLLPRRQQRGRLRDGACESGEGLGVAMKVAQAQAKDVVRLGEPGSERQCLPQRLRTLRGLRRPVQHEAQFVEHSRRLIVDCQICAISRSGAVEAAERRVHVAEQLERPRGGRIQAGGPEQVAQRGIQLMATAVGLATAEIAQHRVRFEGDCAAERLDCGRRVALGQGQLALIDEMPVVALPTALEEAVGSGQTAGQQEQDQQKPFHRAILPEPSFQAPRSSRPRQDPEHSRPVGF